MTTDQPTLLQKFALLTAIFEKPELSAWFESAVEASKRDDAPPLSIPVWLACDVGVIVEALTQFAPVVTAAAQRREAMLAMMQAKGRLAGAEPNPAAVQRVMECNAALDRALVAAGAP